MVVVAVAHVEMVAGVVVEAEAGACENRGSSGSIDGIVSSGSDGGQQQQRWPKQGQWWQRWQQWLLQCQTTTETAGAGNNEQNAAALVVETAVMAFAIKAAWLRRQAGVAVQQK